MSIHLNRLTLERATYEKEIERLKAQVKLAEEQMMNEEGIVLLTEDIRWDINVNVINNNDENVIELAWGWTAGWTEEEIATLADDSPQGHNAVLIDRNQALDLIGDLVAAIRELENK